MLARTLTQAALPSTFGVKVARWLSGLLDAAEPLAALRLALPVQVGGAAGTLAAATELAGSVDGASAQRRAGRSASAGAGAPVAYDTCARHPDRRCAGRLLRRLGARRRRRRHGQPAGNR